LAAALLSKRAAWLDTAPVSKRATWLAVALVEVLAVRRQRWAVEQTEKAGIH
jgi:hypothetical protein